MSTTLDPSATPLTATRWLPADPWVSAGIAALGEALAARSLCDGNPASNAGTAYDGSAFRIEPGRFVTADLEVRWSRHVGHRSIQNRPCTRAYWNELHAAARASIAPPSTR